MGTGHPLGVEPPVISGSEPEGQLIILIIVLPNINVITIAAYIMKGTAGNFYFFEPPFFRIYPLSISSSLICTKSSSFWAISSALLTDSRWSISDFVSSVKL